MNQPMHISALINLIDDPDENIYNQIREKIISFGEEVIPELEKAWEENKLGLEFQSRVENIIHQIQYENVKLQLQNWSTSKTNNLLEGAIAISKYQFPDLNEDFIRNHLKQLRQDIWVELHNDLTAFEKVKILNHIFFNVYNYSGDKDNFHSPYNSYINTVIESKKGNSLALSILYITVAQQLDIPIYGVNLPNHFVVAYVDRENLMRVFTGSEDEQNVLFYINPFNAGAILNRGEIEKFLTKLKLDHHELFFNPCTNQDILQRMIMNLIHSYKKTSNQLKIEELKELYEILNCK